MCDPATLIVNKQAEFTRQFSRTRSQSFTSTVANRFFSDNSLDRQRRVIECTKRRQIRAREKALEQEHQVRILEQAYENRKRLRELQSGRQATRMQRKLEHVAAAYLQHIWKSYRRRKRQKRHQERAGQLIADFIFFRMHQQRRHRHAACLRVQRYWRIWRARHVKAHALIVIQRFLRHQLGQLRRRWQQRAWQIQLWYKRCRAERRLTAAQIIQRRWRLVLFRRQVSQHAKRFRELERFKTLNQAARVVQLCLGRYTARQRILRNQTFAKKYNDLKIWMQLSVKNGSRNHSGSVVDTYKRELTEATRLSKVLRIDEQRLLNDIEALHTRLKESKKRLEDEQERLHRYHAWADVRKAKEEAQFQAQLREWEIRTRMEIRMELEKEMEVERRAKLREKQLIQKVGVPKSQGFLRRASIKEFDARIEVDDL